MKKLERARSIFDYSSLFRPSLPNPKVSLRQRLPWRRCGAVVGGEANASATNFCTTHFGRSTHVGFATWLTTWSNDLHARLRYEHGNDYAIAPLAHARLKVRVSPLRHRLVVPRKIARYREVYFPFRPFSRSTGVLSLPLSFPPHLFALTRETVPSKQLCGAQTTSLPFIKKYCAP